MRNRDSDNTWNLVASAHDLGLRVGYNSLNYLIIPKAYRHLQQAVRMEALRVSSRCLYNFHVSHQNHPSLVMLRTSDSIRYSLHYEL